MATLPGMESYAVDQPVVKSPMNRAEGRSVDIDPKQWGGLAKEGEARFPKGEYSGTGFEFKPEDVEIPEDMPIYHGSGHPFAEGETIKPSKSKFKGVPNAAYGTRSKEDAELYANQQAVDDGRLFGSVYTVAPADNGKFQQFRYSNNGELGDGYLGENTMENTGSPYLGSETGLSQQFSHWTYPRASRD